MITFREISEEDAQLILDWRTKPRVAEMMLSQVTGDIESQREWIRGSFQKPNYYHWIFQNEGRDAGFLSITNIDVKKQSASWGFYVGADEEIGIGATIPAYVYNFMFDNPHFVLSRVDAQVLEINQDVIRMHRLYGYHETPENDFLRPDGQQVRTMVLTRDSWFSKTAFHRFQADFPTSRWAPETT